MTKLGKIPLAAAVLRRGARPYGLISGPEAMATSPVPAEVTVHPNNVMVNTDTKVRGSHFTPGQTVQLVECSQTQWVAPQNPCDTNNTKTVTANGHGAFRTKMKVEACPSGCATARALPDVLHRRRELRRRQRQRCNPSRRSSSPSLNLTSVSRSLH